MSPILGNTLIEVAPGRPESDSAPSRTPIYRNATSKDNLPTSFDGKTTLYELFNASVEKHGPRHCLGYRVKQDDGTAGPYKFMTYKEVQETSRRLAAALMKLGVKKGDRVGVFAPNRVEWMLTIRAVEVLGAAIVPIYDSLGEDSVEYVIKHSEIKMAFVDASKMKKIVDIAPKVVSQVKTIVMMPTLFGRDETKPLSSSDVGGIETVLFDDFVKSGTEAESSLVPTPPAADDLAVLMYTSGTTGTPKGVVLTHRSLVSACASAQHLLKQSKEDVTDHDCMLSYLTLAHSFDRVIEECVLAVGASIGYWQGDVRKVSDDAKALRPTVFIAVPRVLERIVDTVEKTLEGAPAPARAIFGGVYNIKRAMLGCHAPYGMAGLGLDRLIFRKVRNALGGRVRFICSGGAPLPDHVLEFCEVCMAPVLQGYGLTETCALNFVTLPHSGMAGTVGPPTAATEFCLESAPELNYRVESDPPAGEVLIRGPMLASGYLKDEEKTKAAFDDDGFFKTGDIGRIVNGTLKIVDRKKNIFKLAQGEYIAPEHLESIFSRSPAVEQIWVYGNSHESALVAVVVPDKHWIEKYNNENTEEARRSMVQELSDVGKAERIKGFERIKAVHLEMTPFSIEEDLLTPSLKLKRPQLLRRYNNQIEDMYRDIKASSR